ncbi:MAG: precorrin-6A/cobalt-precorrin-6A reductase [Rhodobacteraceae bacterium]|nr:precorrin-6A/cobalt-precorrin-6A reductase [Paracoccaceae bacterium]MCY4197311.1 precorrin-6A/cobalt-precorrin-6A reductase [Paracoccaceae bacterium]
MVSRILVLAGTREAKDLCQLLSERRQFDVIASLAGKVTYPADYPVKIRVGGFGGTVGLADYICRNGFSLIADATHPFAHRITTNAVGAARIAQRPYLRLERPPWEPYPTDHWTISDQLEDLFARLPAGARVFAPLGSGVLQPKISDLLASRRDVRFFVRIAVPSTYPIPPNVETVVVAKPPFSLQSELRLLRKEELTALLCRNSGGTIGKTKIIAARQLQLAVYILSRPPLPIKVQAGNLFGNAHEAAAAIEARLRLT